MPLNWVDNVGLLAYCGRLLRTNPRIYLILQETKCVLGASVATRELS